MESFDVVIAGAGPAGLKCAETLGGSGLGVLVLERENAVGRKVCAGGLTARCLNFLEPPDSLLERSFDSVLLYNRGRSLRLRGEGLLVATADRRALGEWQLSKLGRFSNVEVRTGACVTSVGKDHVVARGERIGFRYLVGADGSSSIVGRSLGIRPRRLAVGIQYTLPGILRPDVELHLDSRLFHARYAWVFPHGDSTVVGCGSDFRVCPVGRMRENLDRWLREQGIDASGSPLEAAPMNHDYQGHRFGNIFLVGDAGGFIFGLSGEGIYPALVSGREAALCILDPLRQDVEISRLLAVKDSQERRLGRLLESGRLMGVVQYLSLAALRIPSFRARGIDALVGGPGGGRAESPE